MKPEGYARVIVNHKGTVIIRDVWNKSMTLEIEQEELCDQLEGLFPDEVRNSEVLVVF